MKGREIVKEIMKEQGVTNSLMANRLNITQAALWDRINSGKVKDIPLSTLNEMLRALDYKIIIVPTDSRVPDKGYKVD